MHGPVSLAALLVATITLSGQSPTSTTIAIVDTTVVPMTSNAGLFRNHTVVVGTIETGRAADLVVLDANPLEDIRNTRTIAGVMMRGRWLSHADRGTILAAIARTAR